MGDVLSITECSSCLGDHTDLPLQDEPTGRPAPRFVVCPTTGARVWVFDRPGREGECPLSVSAAISSPMPLAAEGVTEARKRAAEAEDYARLRLDGILVEARAICAVVGLVPLSRLEGIVEPRKHRKKGRKPATRKAKGGEAPTP